MDLPVLANTDRRRPHTKQPFGRSSVKRIAAKFFPLAVIVSGLSTASAEDIDILVIGSSATYSTGQFSSSSESGTVQERIFNPAEIASELQSILAQDAAITGTANVTFEDIFKTKTHNVDYSGSNNWSVTNRCYSLAQHYMWPEGRAQRLANLRGEATHQWDYIVLFFDPYILGNFPGMMAEGVRLIQEEVAKSANPAQILLFAQWPWESSIFSVDDYNEVVQRVGTSAGLPVVPAGKAWESYTPKDNVSFNIRPTPKGAYLGAASIYSKIFDRSAKSSGYSFASDGSNIADHALAEVQANATIPHYSGAYGGINPFQMKVVTKRVVHYRETGSSTEDGIDRALKRLDDVHRIQFSTSSYPGATGPRWDFNYGRGNDTFEDDKDYEVDPNKYDRSYGFPMHHYKLNSAPNTMPYGIDKQYLNTFNGIYDDGTDLGIAYNMIRPGTRELSLPEDVRAIPIRLMWLKMREISPGFHPLRDNTHMSNHLDDATAAFMYTLLSGRCPVIPEPANQGTTEWLQWLGHKIGYETAWQMSHLTTRVPGFRVLPSSTSATTVTPGPAGTTETMTVQFMYPPQQVVIVNVSTSSPTAAILSPRTLVFTPENHAVPQTVTVAGLPGSPSSEPFEVVFSTSSADEIFDGLGDAWAYTNNRAATESLTLAQQADRSEVLSRDSSLAIDLGVTGSAANNTTIIQPAHGTLTWAGANVNYTPDAGYLGEDRFAFAVNVGGTLTTGYVALRMEDSSRLVFAHSDGDTTVAEGGTSDTYLVTLNAAPGGDVAVTLAPNDQVTVTPSALTFTTSNWNLPQVVTVTAVDDTLHELLHSGTITHTTSSSDLEWNGLSQDFIVTVVDNDNTAPVANAGANQTLTLSGSELWTPIGLSTLAWYDASDAATLTESGGSVIQWADKSGNERHVSQSASSQQPSYADSTVRFDGTDDLLIHNEAFMYANGSVDIYLVSTFPTAPNDRRFLAESSSASNTPVYLPFQTRSSSNVSARTQMSAFIRNDANSTRFNSTALSEEGAFGSSTRKLYQVRDSGSSLSGRINSGGATTAAYSRSGSMTLNQFGIGGIPPRPSSSTGSVWLRADVNEILLVGTLLDDPDRHRLEGYLAHKWGLEANLPADHPHKDTAPGAAVATATLNGSTTDADGDLLTTTWVKVSGPGEVTFADAFALDTTATFSAAGTYVLRLLADDTMVTGFDEITITVRDTMEETYSDWISGFDLGGQTAFNDDYDNDGIPNGLEYFFGTHPGEASRGLSALAVDVSGDPEFTFTHPIAENPASDMIASYLWSKNLTEFHEDGATDEDGDTITFVRGQPEGGMVTVTASSSGTPTGHLFVKIVVTQVE